MRNKNVECLRAAVVDLEEQKGRQYQDRRGRFLAGKRDTVRA